MMFGDDKHNFKRSWIIFTQQGSFAFVVIVNGKTSSLIADLMPFVCVMFIIFNIVTFTYRSVDAYEKSVCIYQTKKKGRVINCYLTTCTWTQSEWALMKSNWRKKQTNPQSYFDVAMKHPVVTLFYWTLVTITICLLVNQVKKIWIIFL